MKLISSIVIVLLLLIAGASAASKVSIPGTPDISLSGKGQKAELVTLEEGLTVFNITNDEISYFGVKLYRPDGGYDRLVNYAEDTPYNGSQLVQIKGGLYGLSIEGEGNWTVNITQIKSSRL
jgi:hypothetical protein